jgi:hypothetical protein
MCESLEGRDFKINVSGKSKGILEGNDFRVFVLSRI